jgi:hypothetical protein
MKLLALTLCLGLPLAAQETVRATTLPRATLRELAAVPLAEQAPRGIRHRWLPPLRATSLRANAFVDAPATTPAPLPARVFLSDSSARIGPADASGAVGPHHVVGAYNSGIVVHDRSGAVLQKLDLARLWLSNAGPGLFYDPRVVYDTKADRWIVMSIYDEQAVMLAISENGDPTGAWRRYQFEERYADFSQLALTADSIILGTSFWPGEHSIFYVIARDDAYANPETLTATRLAVTDAVATPVDSDGGEEVLVTAGPSEIGWRTLDGTWRFASAPQQWTFPDPYLPQLGGAPLDASVGRVEHALERHGWLYAVMTRSDGGTRNSIVWCRVNRVTGASEWGSISAPNTSYDYPSLAVNRAGAMLIGFSVFSPFIHPSSAYVYRSPFGVTSAPTIMVAGNRVVPPERWGDYTTTVVDPIDGSFWTVQPHAKVDRFWETAWAHVDVAGRRRAARH